MINSSHQSAYQYVKIPGGCHRLFCLQQNPFVLAWVLYIRKDTLHYAYKPISEKIPPFIASRRRGNYRLKNNFRILVRFLKHKYHLRTYKGVIGLPFYGQICTPVHQGYKVFDFSRGVVIKLVDTSMSFVAVKNQIEQVKNASEFDFAPSLRRWNVGERWYEEDCFSGSIDKYKIRNTEKLLIKFSEDIAPCMVRLIFCQPPILKNTVEHANKIMEFIKDETLSNQQIEIEDAKTIKKFVCSIAERINTEGNKSFYLVFTHGDFCPANILNTKNGVRILDWESASYKSTLFDFYSYFFFRPVYQKVPVEKIISEIDTALTLFNSKLVKKVHVVSKTLFSLENVYRWMYYIERVSMLVERAKTDKNLDIIAETLRYIDAFLEYDNIIENKPIKSDQ